MQVIDPADALARIRQRVTEQDRGHGTPCWISDRSTNVKGYTKIGYRRTIWYTHRLAYVASFGPIPADMQLDHLCRVKACCNPAHLEAVSSRENLRRSDVEWARRHRTGLCRRGHEQTEANLYHRPDGWLECLICRRARARTQKRQIA